MQHKYFELGHTVSGEGWIFERGAIEVLGGGGCTMQGIHRSLPSPIAPGLVMLKAGRLKRLMGARVMLCGVI